MPNPVALQPFDTNFTLLHANSRVDQAVSRMLADPNLTAAQAVLDDPTKPANQQVGPSIIPPWVSLTLTRNSNPQPGQPAVSVSATITDANGQSWTLNSYSNGLDKVPGQPTTSFSGSVWKNASSGEGRMVLAGTNGDSYKGNGTSSIGQADQDTNLRYGFGQYDNALADAAAFYQRTVSNKGQYTGSQVALVAESQSGVPAQLLFAADQKAGGNNLFSNGFTLNALNATNGVIEAAKNSGVSTFANLDLPLSGQASINLFGPKFIQILNKRDDVGHVTPEPSGTTKIVVDYATSVDDYVVDSLRQIKNPDGSRKYSDPQIDFIMDPLIDPSLRPADATNVIYSALGLYQLGVTHVSQAYDPQSQAAARGSAGIWQPVPPNIASDASVEVYPPSTEPVSSLLIDYSAVPNGLLSIGSVIAPTLGEAIGTGSKAVKILGEKSRLFMFGSLDNFNKMMNNRYGIDAYFRAYQPITGEPLTDSGNPILPDLGKVYNNRGVNPPTSVNPQLGKAMGQAAPALGISGATTSNQPVPPPPPPPAAAGTAAGNAARNKSASAKKAMNDYVNAASAATRTPITPSTQYFIGGSGTVSGIILPPSTPLPPPSTGMSGAFLNANGGTFIQKFPIVIDLNNDGFIATTGVDNSPVMFEYDLPGQKQQTGWTTDGLLIQDSNNNNIVDNASEFFGNSTQTGWDELRSIDSNGNGKIDSGDAVWNQLKVWQDSNQNGVTDTGKLINVPDLKCAA